MICQSGALPRSRKPGEISRGRRGTKEAVGQIPWLGFSMSARVET